MITKVCTHPNCSHNGQPQPVSNFHKWSRAADGLADWCKDCKRAWSAKRYEKIKAEREPVLNYIYPELPPGTKVCANPECEHGGKVQSVSNFHKQSHRKDGLNPWCKDCKKKWAKKYVKSDRNKDAQKKYRRSKKGQAYIRRTYKRMADKYHNDPEYHQKARARNNVARKVFRGQMPPASELTCIECGKPADHYHHHNGYDKEHWYDVVPVCRLCHVELG